VTAAQFDHCRNWNTLAALPARQMLQASHGLPFDPFTFEQNGRLQKPAASHCRRVIFSCKWKKRTTCMAANQDRRLT
jgi:hypothetical protein